MTEDIQRLRDIVADDALVDRLLDAIEDNVRERADEHNVAVDEAGIECCQDYICGLVLLSDDARKSAEGFAEMLESPTKGGLLIGMAVADCSDDSDALAELGYEVQRERIGRMADLSPGGSDE